MNSGWPYFFNILKCYESIVWIHDKEVLTKKEYDAQIKGRTQFTLSFRGSKPILYSLGDAIQILTKLQSEAKRAKLIRKLIIKIEEFLFSR